MKVGFGTRVLNFMIDTPLVLLLSFAAYRGWSFYVFYYGYPYISFLCFWGLVTFLYYLFFEGFFRRTPGKWFSLTVVVNASGSRASLGQVLLRSLVRVAGLVVIDSLFIPILGKTLHDSLSKTEVIEK